MKILDANGASIPALGLGTFNLHGKLCSDIVVSALEAGYRHIDTAAFYDNEAEVGTGIRESKVGRDDIFLTTKVWPTEVSPGGFQRSVKASLDRLNTDYVDLLLIHWPPKHENVNQWADLLNEAVEKGQARNIGVSNFTLDLLDRMVAASDRPICVNQVENHPYLDQSKMRAACAQHRIAMIGYCPLFKGGQLFEETAVQVISQEVGKTPAQVVLRWHVQHERAGAIPKTATAARLIENIDIFDFDLDEEQMAALTNLTAAGHRLCDYDFSPNWDPV